MPEKSHRLRSTTDYARVYKQGRKYDTPYFRAYIRRPVKLNPAEGITALPRFGVVASKKVGGAVDRNRAKRLLREAIRQLMPQMRSEFEMALVAFNSILEIDSTQAQQLLHEVLVKFDLLKQGKKPEVS